MTFPSRKQEKVKCTEDKSIRKIGTQVIINDVTQVGVFSVDLVCKEKLNLMLKVSDF